ncbi:MAG TPA: glycosyltransferase family 4 protein [Saprospiraceae bacterium]|nr:glycosyltransferase family 4 protein [Saprospiraceae bacterium]MCB9270377.1 glycosyltransferase family 4 protein [Lewinellaceae bacterium]HPG08536.1 glycosyltransferase family 4 protein [Saprospiraceae bacterium]HPR00978.1 glycosyltransferase family 4 protein [Saprospiraceae bacterium]HQU51948.1 glycosyltransferase family 4 protein [Saprospiraceae bacterium]
MKWLWIIPDPGSFPSGGNVYNGHLLAALKEEGEEVVMTEWEGWKAHAMRWIPDWVVFDSIYLPQLDRVHLDVLLPVTTRSMLLVHHLASLEADQSGILAGELSQLAKFDVLLVTSPFTQNYLTDHGVRNTIWVLEPPLLLLRGKTGAAQRALQPYLLMVGNLIPRKGILDYLRGLSLTSAEIPVRIVIIGSMELEPEYAAACKAIASSNEILRDQVHFLGTVSHEEIPDWLQGAALFVSASSMETFGIAIQEALASGVPVLCLQGGYAGKLVRQGIDGWVVDDMEALVAATEQWWAGHLYVQDEQPSVERTSSSYQQLAETLIRYSSR